MSIVDLRATRRTSLTPAGTRPGVNFGMPVDAKTAAQTFTQRDAMQPTTHNWNIRYTREGSTLT